MPECSVQSPLRPVMFLRSDIIYMKHLLMLQHGQGKNFQHSIRSSCTLQYLYLSYLKVLQHFGFIAV